MAFSLRIQKGREQKVDYRCRETRIDCTAKEVAVAQVRRSVRLTTHWFVRHRLISFLEDFAVIVYLIFFQPLL